MKFLANENFPLPSIKLLRKHKIEIISIAEQHQGISDHEVMQLAIEQNLIILTHDSDYGELIFKHGYKPKAGVIYFRIFNFEATEPGQIIIELINKDLSFEDNLTVIDENSIRQRNFL